MEHPSHLLAVSVGLNTGRYLSIGLLQRDPTYRDVHTWINRYGDKPLYSIYQKVDQLGCSAFVF